MPLPESAQRPTSRLAALSAPEGLRRAVAGAVLIAAGFAIWRNGALNEALFHAMNDLGAAAPAAWSWLSVAGLGLSAWIYLSALAQREPGRVARLSWILVAGGIVINLVKHRFDTMRPLAALGEGHLTVVGEQLRTHSMPSGHSAMAFAMLGLMAAPLPAANRGGAIAQRCGWTLLAFGIALSRLAVGAHWPCDVAVGAGLGLLFAGLSARAWPVGALTRFLRTPAGCRVMAVGMVASALSIAATPTLFAVFGLAGSTLEKRLSSGYPLAEPLQWALGGLALVGAARWWRAARLPRGGAH